MNKDSSSSSLDIKNFCQFFEPFDLIIDGSLADFVLAVSMQSQEVLEYFARVGVS